VRLLIVLLAIVLAGAGVCSPAGAQERHYSFHYVRIRTASPVVLETLAAEEPPVYHGGILNNVIACPTFVNTDVRTATAVRITVVFYDENGTRKSSQLISRAGTFATGVRQEGLGGCARLRLPDADDLVIASYVDSVAFADGSAWTAEGIMLPDHVIPGTLVAAPEPAAVSAIAADVDDLAPEIVGTYPNCASGLALPPGDPKTTVLVGVQPGAPIGDGLYHIGDVASCAPSADVEHDAAAAKAVAAMPVAVVRAAAFRVYFPTVDVAASCNASARLLNRRIISAPGDGRVGLTPLGDYAASAHVDVRADGYPSAVTIAESSKRPAFDEGLRLSALASRYWPAIVNGAPAPGSYDFAMRWDVAGKPGGKITFTTYGPSTERLPAACLAH